jgi:PhnB protein
MTSQAIPHLCVKGAPRAIEFYVAAFGAREVMRLEEPSGRIGHAELEIDGARIMLADEYPELGITSPLTLGGTSMTISLTVANADDATRQAREAGATVEREPTDEFYGDRSATIRDPFGHRWHLSHRIETLSAEEMQRRYDELMKAGQ